MNLCELSTALCPCCDPPGTSCQKRTISLNSNLRFHLLLKRLNPVKVAPPAHHLTCQLPQVVPAIRLGGLPSFPYTLNDVDFELFKHYNDKVPIFNFKQPTIKLAFPQFSTLHHQFVTQYALSYSEIIQHDIQAMSKVPIFLPFPQVIPDICPFWYNATFLRPEKVH